MEKVTRYNKATVQRMVNFKKIIHHMQTKGDMSISEMCTLIDMKNSGARKYATDLRNDGIIHIVSFKDKIGNQINGARYAVTKDHRAIENFIAKYSISDPEDNTERPDDNGYLQRQMKNGVYSQFRRLPTAASVRRDPLVAFLFGA